MHAWQDAPCIRGKLDIPAACVSAHRCPPFVLRFRNLFFPAGLAPNYLLAVNVYLWWIVVKGNAEYTEESVAYSNNRLSREFDGKVIKNANKRKNVGECAPPLVAGKGRKGFRV